ncbi:MAG: ABC transporter permease subunit [Pseudomonadota bacterium]
MLPAPLRTALSLAGLVGVWAVAAALSADPTVLPGPVAVLKVAAREAAAGELFFHVACTLARVAAAFALAMGVGVLLGLLLGRFPKVDAWADPIVLVFLNVPALVVIVLCYLWIGLNEIGAIAAVSINKTAMVIVTMREGARTLSPPLGEMAHVFRLSPAARLIHVVWPQLAPFLAASARNGLAIIWKIVLVAEFLGRGNGVGFQIHLYFQLFETGTVLAYALTFVAVMLAIEFLILKPIDTRARRWRTA